MNHISHLRILLLTGLLTVSALSSYSNAQNVTTDNKNPEAREIDMSWGPVKIRATISPAAVRYDRDVLLQIHIETDSNISVTMPDLNDRIEGFVLSGQYGGDVRQENGRNIMDFNYRLTPSISDSHRIAPFPVVYEDASKSPPYTNWFAAQAIKMTVAPVTDKSVADIDESIDPVWIYPSRKEIAVAALIASAVFLITALTIMLAGKLRREAQLRKMSPRERALRELEKLIAKQLPKKEKVKEFYLELTMIVRRYIERAHKVHAPEQTTEEFLHEVSKDTRFNADVIQTLKEFLEAADLVKFAAYRPGEDAVDESTRTARNYIDTDDKRSSEFRKAEED